MYVLAEIDGGGFIYTLPQAGGREMVHKESIFPLRHEVLYEQLRFAEADLPEESPYGNPTFILRVEEGDGADMIWCHSAVEELIRKRLRTWSGCYGAWPVRRISGKVVPLSRA